MPTKKTKAPQVLNMLMDPKVKMVHRRHLLAQHLLSDDEASQEICLELFKRLSAASADEVAAKRAKEYEEKIKELEDGPIRAANFRRFMQQKRRAEVVLEDGTTFFPVVPEELADAELACGDRLFADGKGKIVLFSEPGVQETGEEATLNRHFEGTTLVEVALHDIKMKMDASAALMEKIESGEAEPGCDLLVCQRRRMAFDMIPPADGLAHYRYLERRPVPDVDPERDMGAPPAYIDDVLEHVAIEMTDRDLSTKYRMSSCLTVLLEGLTGTGKTFSVQALEKKMYDVISEVAGVAVEDLPPRVFRLRASQIYSKWLGESDKNLFRFFAETEQLAAEEFITPAGQVLRLPVLGIIEECDGMAQSRGQDSVYDRILTTALQQLDTGRPELRDLLIIYVASTNISGQLDAAFLRRLGGEIVHFGHLKRRPFSAVLTKRLRDLPIVGSEDDDEEQARKRIVNEIAAWVYCAQGADVGQVELTMSGSAEHVTKYRRDFMTPAIVDRAVGEACKAARRAERRGCGEPGLSLQLLASCFDRQLRSLCDQLTLYNLEDYIELPDGAHVATVRRMPQPAILPFDLRRAAS